VLDDVAGVDAGRQGGVEAQVDHAPQGLAVDVQQAVDRPGLALAGLGEQVLRVGVVAPHGPPLLPRTGRGGPRLSPAARRPSSLYCREWARRRRPGWRGTFLGGPLRARTIRAAAAAAAAGGPAPGPGWGARFPVGLTRGVVEPRQQGD